MHLPPGRQPLNDPFLIILGLRFQGDGEVEPRSVESGVISLQFPPHLRVPDDGYERGLLIGLLGSWSSLVVDRGNKKLWW